MGQIQNKYHITDDGKIFSVMEDGSVSEIGNVSSLNQTKNVEEPKQPKSRKWKWVAVISWIVLIIATITFLVQYNYEAGRWTFQICYDDVVVYSTTFDIQ